MIDSVTIKLEIPPSVNHAYKNAPHRYVTKRGEIATRSSRILTDEALSWIAATKLVSTRAARQAGWKIRESKVVLEIEVFWPDARRRDTHNLHKLLGDALEGIIVINDSLLLIRDLDFEIDRKDPGVWVRWYDKDVSERGIRRREANDDTRAV